MSCWHEWLALHPSATRLQVVDAATAVITRIVYHSAEFDSAESVSGALPSKVDARLAGLVGKVREAHFQAPLSTMQLWVAGDAQTT